MPSDIDARTRGRSAASELPSSFKVKRLKDIVKLRGPNSVEITVPREALGCVSALLNVFAPTGVPSINGGTRFMLVDTATGRQVEFNASSIIEVAEATKAYCFRTSSPAVSTPSIPTSSKPLVPGRAKGTSIPEWISGDTSLGMTIMGDDGDFRLDFVPLKLVAGSKNKVQHEETSGSPDCWGYRITVDDTHTGWVILEGPDCFVISGIGERKPSKHRNLISTLYRISSCLRAMDRSRTAEQGNIPRPEPADA